jgi:hypothetical protein
MYADVPIVHTQLAVSQPLLQQLCQLYMPSCACASCCALAELLQIEQAKLAVAPHTHTVLSLMLYVAWVCTTAASLGPDLLCAAAVTAAAAAAAVVLPAPSVCFLCVCCLFVCVRLFVCVPKVLPTRSATH